MNKEKIALGATVVILNEETNTKTSFTLVDDGNADITKGLVSAAAPLGRALIDSSVGDEITVRAPAGAKKYTVLSASLQE